MEYMIENTVLENWERENFLSKSSWFYYFFIISLKPSHQYGWQTIQYKLKHKKVWLILTNELNTKQN